MQRENYSYKKFQREAAQKKKRDEKLQRRQNKKNGVDSLVPDDLQKGEEG